VSAPAGSFEPAAAAAADEAFVVTLEVFEGPLDLLLDLARKQKVDLGRVSILRLAEQYLAYLEGLRTGHQLPVAAEYLVMAAWLAYLKSQLLLPPAEREVPDPEAVAGALEDRLRLLEAIRRGAAALLGRPRLGVARFPRGPAGEGLPVTVRTEYRAGLAELLAAYSTVSRRGTAPRMTFPARRLDSVEAALERLSRLLTGVEWRDLMSFLPPGFGDGLPRRSAVAASFVAGLELARSGEVELQQAAPFAPIMVRRR
jgi:segregation and condensation protein A